jgi:protein-tyrosine phosphatase
MSYAEIHFHLLPGIDDGPSSIEESVELAAAAAAEGTGTIVATPHVHPQFVTEPKALVDQVDVLRARLSKERIAIDVLCGGELDHQMVERLSDSELDTIALGPPGRRWLLLEAPLRGLDGSYTVAAEALRARGFAVVVAHPERALGKSEAGWQALEHELGIGSVLQVNAWSIAGRYGQRVRDVALSLLERAPRAVIASDAHGGRRMPALTLALEALAEARVPQARRLAEQVPRELLERGLSVRPDALAA